MFTVGIEKLKIDPVKLTDYQFGEEKKMHLCLKVHSNWAAEAGTGSGVSGTVKGQSEIQANTHLLYDIIRLNKYWLVHIDSQ
jgi:hypothetical protein